MSNKADKKVVEPDQVPTNCHICGLNVLFARFYYKGFDVPDVLHIGIVCENLLCGRREETGERKVRFLTFKNHGSWIKEIDLERLQLDEHLGKNPVIDLGPDKEPVPCSYSGCERTQTERHHIMPRAYADDADLWPLVVLCTYHHDKWHAMLTTGLLHRARSHNMAEYRAIVRTAAKYGYDELGESVDFYRPFVERDFEEAHAAALHASTNSKYAAMWANESYKQLQEIDEQ
tara:strand:- start:100 stop:795 length:696 start_codon:yes stop_codon:yes gene_type:complete